MRKYLLPAMLAIVFASCSESGPSSPGNPSPAPNLPSYSTGPVQLTDIYDQLPNVASCFEGRLKAGEAQKVLSYVNQIRALHGLLPVEYRDDDNARTARASLVIAATSKLSHTPESTVACFTPDAYDGSSTSNLAYRSGANSPSESFIDLWLSDIGVVSLGHRRWLIDPFLRYISFGRCDRTGTGSITGSAIKVIYGEQRDISATTTDFVAYPFHDYPSRLLPTGSLQSLTVVANRTNKGASGSVSYASATVSVTDAAGATMPTSEVTSDNAGYGISNNLRWKTTGLKAGVQYVVEVRNVMVAGVSRTYSWWFALAA